MVTVKVYTKDEYDEAATRAYDHISKDYIERAETKTQLINTLDEMYFKGKGVPQFLSSVGRAFERNGYWQPKEIKISFPEIPEERLVPEEEPKEVKIEVTKYIRPKKAKKVKPRIAPQAYSEEFIVNYVNNRPSRAKGGQIYKVTKKKRLIKRTTYLKRMKNLAKGWYRKRQKGVS